MALEWLVRLLQAVVTAGLIAIALAWMARSSVRRRHLARGTPARRILAYPRWTLWLGLSGSASFAACGWFAWHAPPTRGGPWTALVFLAFLLLGVGITVLALAETWVVDGDGVERVRFGRAVRLAWSDLTCLAPPRGGGGPGVRLEGRGGLALEVPSMLEGFGVLCDELLQRAPGTARVLEGASEAIVLGSTLAPEPLQRRYAPWFEREESEPAPQASPTELAVMAGRAFAARMLVRHDAFVPFESRQTRDGAVRITHGEPRGDEPGYAAFRFDGEALVITTDGGTEREPVDPG